jgi:predicted ferric reductase
VRGLALRIPAVRQIKIGFAALLLTLLALWMLSDTTTLAPVSAMGIRTPMVNLTGVLAMGAMSVAMILAIRPESFESLLNGLDKMYRLHKWLGVTGAGLALAHLAFVDLPQLLEAMGASMPSPHRGGARATVEGFAGVLFAQRHAAESVGMLALVALLALVAVALIRQVPYRLFVWTHRLLAVVYLALVYHAVVLLPVEYWRAALGVPFGLLLAGGVAGAVLSLVRRVGYVRRTVGTVTAVVPHADNRVLEVAVRLAGRWPGHAAGQFAFVSFDRSEGPHPFTITSAWEGDGALRFLIKELGDYTRRLPGLLHTGDTVRVEGPYGRFVFDGGLQHQIWVGGGIGITPFVARMEQLAGHRDGRHVDLFYATREPDAAFIALITRIARDAKVRLHVIVEATDGLLDAARIRALVPEWRAADLWFCGPTRFGGALRAGFMTSGMRSEDFHQELFSMR